MAQSTGTGTLTTAPQQAQFVSYGPVAGLQRLDAKQVMSFLDVKSLFRFSCVDRSAAGMNDGDLWHQWLPQGHPLRSCPISEVHKSMKFLFLVWTQQCATVGRLLGHVRDTKQIKLFTHEAYRRDVLPQLPNFPLCHEKSAFWTARYLREQLGFRLALNPPKHFDIPRGQISFLTSIFDLCKGEGATAAFVRLFSPDEACRISESLSLDSSGRYAIPPMYDRRKNQTRHEIGHPVKKLFESDNVATTLRILAEHAGFRTLFKKLSFQQAMEHTSAQRLDEVIQIMSAFGTPCNGDTLLKALESPKVSLQTVSTLVAHGALSASTIDPTELPNNCSDDEKRQWLKAQVATQAPVATSKSS